MGFSLCYGLPGSGYGRGGRREGASEVWLAAFLLD